MVDEKFKINFLKEFKLENIKQTSRLYFFSIFQKKNFLKHLSKRKEKTVIPAMCFKRALSCNILRFIDA